MTETGYFKVSIAKKVFMSLTGLFLIVFLLVHLGINLLLLVSADLFNAASHFMATHPVILVMQWVLAAGFVLHIIYATLLTVENKIARPIGYQQVNGAANSLWASRNMFVLGTILFLFLVLHLKDFFYVMKFGDMDGKSDYELVVSVFQIWYYAALYIVAFILLGFHLSHGFQSAFQSLGCNHPKYTPCLKKLGIIYSIIVPLGFIIIPLYFLLLN